MNLNAGLSATHSHYTLRLCCYIEQFWHKGTLQAVWLLVVGRRERTFSRANLKLRSKLLIKTVTNLCNPIRSVGPVSLAIFTEINTCQHVYVKRREVTSFYTSKKVEALCTFWVMMK